MVQWEMGCGPVMPLEVVEEYITGCGEEGVGWEGEKAPHGVGNVMERDEIGRGRRLPVGVLGMGGETGTVSVVRLCGERRCGYRAGRVGGAELCGLY
ncbi:hypothetical protein Tco_1211931 [Tanacetum coccineum]